MNKQVTNERLNRLADIVEASMKFRQQVHTECAIGLARAMYVEETGNTPHSLSFKDEGMAEYFGLTVSEIDALYLANY